LFVGVPFCSISLAQQLDRSRNPLLSECLRFSREKPLKMNFYGIRIWEIFSIKRILKRAEEMIIR